MPVDPMLRNLVCDSNGEPKHWHDRRNRGRPRQRWSQSVYKMMIAWSGIYNRPFLCVFDVVCYFSDFYPNGLKCRLNCYAFSMCVHVHWINMRLQILARISLKVSRSFLISSWLAMIWFSEAMTIFSKFTLLWLSSSHVDALTQWISIGLYSCTVVVFAGPTLALVGDVSGEHGVAMVDP